MATVMERLRVQGKTYRNNKLLLRGVSRVSISEEMLDINDVCNSFRVNKGRSLIETDDLCEDVMKIGSNLQTQQDRDLNTIGNVLGGTHNQATFYVHGRSLSPRVDYVAVNTSNEKAEKCKLNQNVRRQYLKYLTIGHQQNFANKNIGRGNLKLTGTKLHTNMQTKYDSFDTNRGHTLESFPQPRYYIPRAEFPHGDVLLNNNLAFLKAKINVPRTNTNDLYSDLVVRPSYNRPSSNPLPSAPKKYEFNSIESYLNYNRPSTVNATYDTKTQEPPEMCLNVQGLGDQNCKKHMTPHKKKTVQRSRCSKPIRGLTNIVRCDAKRNREQLGQTLFCQLAPDDTDGTISDDTGDEVTAAEMNENTCNAKVFVVRLNEALGVTDSQ